MLIKLGGSSRPSVRIAPDQVAAHIDALTIDATQRDEGADRVEIAFIGIRNAGPSVRNSTVQSAPVVAAEFDRGARQVVADGTLIRLVAGCGPAAEEPKQSASIGEAELVVRAEALAEARRMSDGIAGVLALLRNFDRLVPGEPEHVRID